MGESTAQTEALKLPIETAQILEILPHRPPFLMVDRIIELEPKTSVRGIKTISANDPWFVGHFPGRPIMPGVLMIEAIAQTGAIMLLVDPNFKNQLALFAGADKVRAKRVVVPGEVMDIQVLLDYFKMNVGRISGTIHVGGELAMTAQVRFKFVDI